MSAPRKNDAEELATTLTYIEEGQFDSVYARELCRRAGNIEEWESGRYNAQACVKATKKAAENFGYLFM